MLEHSGSQPEILLAISSSLVIPMSYELYSAIYRG